MTQKKRADFSEEELKKMRGEGRQRWEKACAEGERPRRAEWTLERRQKQSERMKKIAEAKTKKAGKRKSACYELTKEQIAMRQEAQTDNEFWAEYLK